MLQTNTLNDPIVEILRLAYRRGLAIQREQEEKSQVLNPQSSEHENSNSVTEAREEQTKVSG